MDKKYRILYLLIICTFCEGLPTTTTIASTSAAATAVAAINKSRLPNPEEFELISTTTTDNLNLDAVVSTFTPDDVNDGKNQYSYPIPSVNYHRPSRLFKLPLKEDQLLTSTSATIDQSTTTTTTVTEEFTTTDEMLSTTTTTHDSETTTDTTNNGSGSSELDDNQDNETEDPKSEVTDLEEFDKNIPVTTFGQKPVINNYPGFYFIQIPHTSTIDVFQNNIPLQPQLLTPTTTQPLLLSTTNFHGRVFYTPAQLQTW